MRLAHWEAHDRDDYLLGDKVYQRENLEWRQVPGEEYYYVSNYGDIAMLPHDAQLSNGGHKHYDLTIHWSEDQYSFGGSHGHDYKGINMHRRKYYVHRITALAFIPNPNDKPEINHIDGNTKNNYAGCKQNQYRDSNLEWVDRQENMQHASRLGLINRDSELRKQTLKENRTHINYDNMKRPVIQLDQDGNFIQEYESSLEAERQTGIYYSTISACCRHQKYRKSAGGYKWVFREEYETA